MHVSLTAVATALSVTALVSCGGAATGAVPVVEADRNVTAQGTFAAAPATPPTYDSTLVPVGADAPRTPPPYDSPLVPVGATASVTAGEAGTSTNVTLEVTGLQPNRQYGAHAHTKPCGGDGKDAGPHFQFKPDPVTPSVDPAYANNVNEIWLDFTTDAAGAGRATATVP